MTNIYYIEHADTCQLAHYLTLKHFGEDKPNKATYQSLHEYFVTMIEDIMMKNPVATLKEFNRLK